jgi:hypothetical protein
MTFSIDAGLVCDGFLLWMQKARMACAGLGANERRFFQKSANRDSRLLSPIGFGNDPFSMLKAISHLRGSKLAMAPLIGFKGGQLRTFLGFATTLSISREGRRPARAGFKQKRGRGQALSAGQGFERPKP